MILSDALILPLSKLQT